MTTNDDTERIPEHALFGQATRKEAAEISTMTDAERWKHERENGLMPPDMAKMYDTAKAQIESLTFDRDYAQERYDVALKAANKALGQSENWQTFELVELVESLRISWYLWMEGGKEKDTSIAERDETIAQLFRWLAHIESECASLPPNMNTLATIARLCKSARRGDAI